MPLLDHFHGEVELDFPWPTLAQAWAVSLMSWLNRTLSRDDYLALTNVRLGTQVEADVAEYRREELAELPSGVNGSVATLTSTPPALFTIPAIFPDDIEVEVCERRGGRPIVGVIELISPGNKKEREERDAFVAKCVTYLRRGIGLVLVDVVTERRWNLHNELMKVIGGAAPTLMADVPTFVTGYRPVHRREASANEIEIWPLVATIGEAIPSVSFSLRGGPVVVLDLEAAYADALRAGGM